MGKFFHFGRHFPSNTRPFSNLPAPYVGVPTFPTGFLPLSETSVSFNDILSTISSLLASLYIAISVHELYISSMPNGNQVLRLAFALAHVK